MSEASPDTGPTIAVCVKFTLDAEQLTADPATGEPVVSLADRKINTFDLNGIEAGLALRDEHGGRVLGVTLASGRPPESLVFQSLAMGLDELHLVTGVTAAVCDALGTATALAQALRSIGPPDLVICSDTSVDDYRGEVGPRLAEALGVPCLTYVTALELQDGRLRAERTLESVVETVECDLPAVVSVGSQTNEPRLPNLRAIRVARTKPVLEHALADVPGAEAACAPALERIATVSVQAPPSERRHVAVEGESGEEMAQALLRHLLDEGALRL
jgi:electron transfer flavoprotein beta subunit